LFARLQAVDQPEAVFEDEGIDQDGFGLRLADFVGGNGEFFLLQLGGVFVATLAGQGAEAIGLLVKLRGGLVALVAKLVAISAAGFLPFAGGEFDAQGDQVIEGGNDGCFNRVQWCALGCASGAGIAGVVA
jgi:hypothetical protein